MKLAAGGVNKTQFSCAMFTQGYNKLRKQLKRLPEFSN